MKIILAFLLALFLSSVLTPLFEALARRLKILDYPGNDKIHQNPTPLLGGAAIFFSFLIVILSTVIKELNNMHLSLLLAGTIIFVTGLIDDIKPFSAIIRIFIQFAAALILVSCGMYFTFLPDTIIGRALEIILTFIWIVGITNAFNYLDGLNGLATGAAAINTVFFFVFAIMTGQPILAYILAVFVGVCLGFLPYNFLKAEIFLGSSGSTWIGFTLAGLAVMGDWAQGNPADLVIPILIFGVPIFDMVTTTVFRIIDKKTKNVVEWLMYRGKDHFHHRLSQIGLGNIGAVWFIYLVCIMLGLNALLLQMSQGLSNAVIILCASILNFVLISLLMTVPLRNNKDEAYNHEEVIS